MLGRRIVVGRAFARRIALQEERHNEVALPRKMVSDGAMRALQLHTEPSVGTDLFGVRFIPRAEGVLVGEVDRDLRGILGAQRATTKDRDSSAAADAGTPQNCASMFAKGGRLR